MLRVWNMVLVALAFSLSIFGTFLTRSGVINSIHSFSQSPLGGWFLGFIVLTTTFSAWLIWWRLPLLRARTKLESLVSREATFLYNNLPLVAFCLTILWGVVYPLLTQALRDETRSVSKPYYNFFLHSFGLPLLLLMGIGPLVAWRRASLRSLGRTFAWPAGVALATGVVLLALGAGSSIPGLVGYTFSAFVLASIVLEFVRGTNARHATSGEGWGRSFSSLIGRTASLYCGRDRKVPVFAGLAGGGDRRFVAGCRPLGNRGWSTGNKRPTGRWHHRGGGGYGRSGRVRRTRR